MNRLQRSESVLLLCTTFLVVISLISSSALGQVTSGTIFGSIKDPSGAYVRGATVTVVNPENGLARTVTTSDSGEFVAPGLYPGSYSIVVEAASFKKLEKSGLVLSAGGKLDAGQLVLALGAAAESVNVVA